MMDGDIYGDVLLRCQVSSSQEEHLRRTSFTREPYVAAPPHPSDSDSDSDSVPVDSTAIMMVSPPDSLDDFRDAVNNTTSVSTCPSHDVFRTPPEDSVDPPPPPPTVDAGSQTVEVDVGFVDDSGTGTVELGLDSDLGFSEAQESQRFRVLSGEEPLKKSKSAGGTETETGSEFMDAEIGEERRARRKAELEWVGSEKEAGRELVETRRRLPDWKQSGDEVRRVQSKSSFCEGSENFSILDALKWFKENGGDDDDDESVATSGFVEICEKKGMAFPRPTWWL